MDAPSDRQNNLDSPFPAARPSASTLLTIALCTALLFAWLGVYALTNALVAAELIPPFINGQDPRLRWLGIAVAFILTLQLSAFATLRHISQRHQKNLDDLDDPDEDLSPTFAAPPAVSAAADHSPGTPAPGTTHRTLAVDQKDPRPTPPPGPGRRAA